MSDRITVNTDKMAGFVRELQRMSDKLNDNASSLRRADFSECGGGGVVDYQRISLKCSGRTVSGSRAPSLVDSFADGLTATGSYVSTLARHVQEVLSRFEEAENEIVAIGEGEEERTEREAGSFYKYVPKYDLNTVDEGAIFDRNRERWEADNEFIGTAYDEMVKSALYRAIMEEDKFSKRNWELCKTTEQRQKYIEEMARMIAVAYGIDMETSLEHGVHIIDGGDSVTFMVNGQSVTESVGAGEGVNSPDGYIVININEQSFVSIVGVLCHEMRHELQRNMVDETNLKESKYVLNESEYADISKEVNQWRQNANGSYISMEDSIIDVQKEEIWDKMSWIQKITKGEDWAEWAARVEVYEMYSGEPVEVDARYMEEYAESIMFMRQIMDTMHISSARRGQGIGGVMGSR